MRIPSLTTAAEAVAPERTPRFTRRTQLVLGAAVAALTALALMTAAGSASAHSWAGWHWDRGGSYVPVNIWNYAGTTHNEAEAARADIHQRPHPVYLLNATSHTDVSVFDTYEPAANYCGLAEIVNWYWSLPWQYHISHAHARYNTACGTGGSLPNFAQGVYCQEIGHTLGLDHSDTGDCMGLGYFAGSSGRYCFGTTCSPSDPSHPSDDLYNMYRFH